MAKFLTDLRVAVRSLAKARGLTATIILTLGLGVTVCTSTMAIVTGYLMSNLPYPAAERLYSIRYNAPGQVPPREMERLDWPSLSDVIEHPIAWDLDMFYLLGGD